MIDDAFVNAAAEILGKAMVDKLVDRKSQAERRIGWEIYSELAALQRDTGLMPTAVRVAVARAQELNSALPENEYVVTIGWL